MDHSSVSEKRKFQRFRHSESVHYQLLDPEQSGGCVAKDLSEGGIRIQLNRFMPLNEEVMLNIRLFGENMVECTGRVAWCEKSRFGESYVAGLRFLPDETNIDNQRKIYGFLSHQ